MEQKRIDRAVAHLSEAVRIPTVSDFSLENMDLAVFDDFKAFLCEAYPFVFRKLELTIVNDYGLIFRWAGEDSEKLPLLLMAHYDVVPAEPDGWPHGGPFSGAVAEGRIWGRGSFDDKSSLIGILESVESLLEEGFVPARDIWLAFGFDEEHGGEFGTKKMVLWFREKGIRFELVLDEGGAIADGSMVGIDRPVAVIGMAEKANSSVAFTFKGQEGHSSTPPEHTSVGKMASFIHAVESHPLPIRLTETPEAMLRSIAPYMPGIQSKIIAHPRLFFPLIRPVLMKSKQTAAMLRTTIAFTVCKGGSAPNVLPKEATCVANLRVLQGDTTAGVVDYMKKISGNMACETKTLMLEEPTRAASVDSPPYRYLEKTINTLYPEVVVVPYLMVGGTDSRHYDDIADNVLRFQPVRVSDKELSLMHATGEYLSIENVEHLLLFYDALIRGLERMY